MNATIIKVKTARARRGMSMVLLILHTESAVNPTKRKYPPATAEIIGKVSGSCGC